MAFFKTAVVPVVKDFGKTGLEGGRPSFTSVYERKSIKAGSKYGRLNGLQGDKNIYEKHDV